MKEKIAFAVFFIAVLVLGMAGHIALEYIMPTPMGLE
jgi:hypothetical protein